MDGKKRQELLRWAEGIESGWYWYVSLGYLKGPVMEPLIVKDDAPRKVKLDMFYEDFFQADDFRVFVWSECRVQGVQFDEPPLEPARKKLSLFPALKGFVL